HGGGRRAGGGAGPTRRRRRGGRDGGGDHQHPGRPASRRARAGGAGRVRRGRRRRGHRHRRLRERAGGGGGAWRIRARAGRAAAGGAGATLAGAGRHPPARPGEFELVDSPRYRDVEDAMRGLMRRSPECALHVHVGVPDAATAIGVFNRLREHLPLLAGLAANSPWWFGRDSGFASARAAQVRAYPGRGVPPPFAGYDEYLAALEAAAAGGGPDDYTLLWWAVRPPPRLGTVEVRELDAPSRGDDAAAPGA